jgi:hypothetical protein
MDKKDIKIATEIYVYTDGKVYKMTAEDLSVETLQCVYGDVQKWLTKEKE